VGQAASAQGGAQQGDVRAGASTGSALLLEEFVEYRRELAVLVARSSTGETATYSVVESRQVNGVCKVVIAPAPEISAESAEQAESIARQIAERLDVVGILAVEMFEGLDGRILVNELAMRPHNSGHWTINGAVTSQFENHLRAVAGLPLGNTSATANWTVMVNILGSTRNTLAEALPGALARDSRAKINLYGKGIRPGRKLGHINISGDNLAELLENAQWIARYFEQTDDQEKGRQ
jgi:5-(carboxyamino)imidazole ribonucleotide synthase